jgi:hypothetical protein
MKPIAGGNSQVIDVQLQRANCSPVQQRRNRINAAIQSPRFQNLAEKIETVALG